MGLSKLAYYVKATFADYGDEPLHMIVHHAGPKADLERILRGGGWVVLQIRNASMDDIADIAVYEDVLQHVRQTLKDKRRAEAKQERDAEIARRRLREETRTAKVAQEKEADESRDLALFRAAGDLLNTSLSRSCMATRKWRRYARRR